MTNTSTTEAGSVKSPKKKVVVREKLTEMQQRFINHYMASYPRNATKSAAAAGYKNAANAGCELLKMDWVKEKIAKEMLLSSKRTEITVDTIKKKLVELIDGCMQKVPVLDDEGNETGFYKFIDASTARAAIKDLGDTVDVQAFVRGTNINVNNTTVNQSDAIDVSKLSVEEQKNLMAMIVKAKSALVMDNAPKRIESTSHPVIQKLVEQNGNPVSDEQDEP